MLDTIPPDQLIAPRRAGGAIVAIIFGLIALCVGAIALPHDRYVRFQQFGSGDISQLRYVYERLHFDPTPIDVAIIGSSRIEAAISAPNLQRALSRRLGRPIHVANLAVPLEGRNLHYVIARELIRTHPETRLVLLSLVEPIRQSHPAFRNVADVGDVLGSPLWINYFWLGDVTFLPYRQISLFLQSLAPTWFGVRTTFVPSEYRGADFDSTRSFRLENGKLVDRDTIPRLDKLEHEAAARNAPGRISVVARLLGDHETVIETTLTRRLARTFAARCTALVFVHLPTWRGRAGDVDVAGNARYAPVLMTPAWVGSDWFDYSDAGHLRRSGTDEVSRWLPGAVAPYLGTLHQPPRCETGVQAG